MLTEKPTVYDAETRKSNYLIIQLMIVNNGTVIKTHYYF